MGTPTVSTVVLSSPAMTEGYQPAEDWSERQGAASMGMRAQTWWLKSSGFDGKTGHIHGWKRRESRRRGEEDFLHDYDKFELTVHNLKHAPGSMKKKIRRGRGKYGNYGRTCGWGMGGRNKRGKGSGNTGVGFESGHTPLHISSPKLKPEDKAMGQRDKFTKIFLWQLDMFDDGEEVAFEDLVIRGIPCRSALYKWPQIKLKGSEESAKRFTTKNLTVFAHAFEPIAREAVEKNGGKCIRLHPFANLPLDGLDQSSGAPLRMMG